MIRRTGALLGSLAALWFLASCASAPEPSEVIVETVVVTEAISEPGETVADTAVVEAEEPVPEGTPPPAPTEPASIETTPTPAPTATQPGLPTSPPPTGQPLPTPTVVVEPRVIELEWPPTMRLGDSDVVRLALIPDEEGYTVQADFPDHQTQTQSFTVDRPPGYALYAAARMDGVGFEISPNLELERYLPQGESVVWRWTITPRRAGQQRLSVSLRLRWKPPEGVREPVRESMALSQALDIRVVSFLGLTRPQAMLVGFLGLILGGGLSLSAVVFRPRTRSDPLRTLRPNPSLTLEPPADLAIPEAIEKILRTLFSRYGRLVIAQEFPAGYSGARTFLVKPVHQDGRTDAFTIAKVGPRKLIRQEYDNYETYVKDRLPPVTARIQHAPVTLRGSDQAGLQYTFIGAPGQPPRSLRIALLEDPDPTLLYALFDTFGPNWWMQRRPYTFRIAQEYDRVLPPHYLIAPAEGRARALDGRAPPGDRTLKTGDLVTLRGFKEIEPRPDGKSQSLHGASHPGQPPLRVRWLSRAAPDGAVGRVVATRSSYLAELTAGFDRFGLPDPMEKLADIVGETIQGTQSTIHGDLNLENILQGPGGMVWLIDFAQTREGHTLLDFAHLHAELIAHVIAARGETPEAYLARLKTGAYPLLSAVREVAGRCLFDAVAPREFDLAVYMVSLGALKFVNMTVEAKQLLYLTTAYLSEGL